MKTALLIEDDPVMLRLLSHILEEDGWKVWEAADGDKGIALFREHRPRAVITDLLLPRVNGFQVISAVRSESSAAHTRIVALSSKSFPSDKQRALELGADVFLEKPVNPAAFASLLNELTRAQTEEGQFQKGAATSPMRLKFWGVRGSVPTPGPNTVYYGGNTSCVEVRAGGEIIILDSGTGIRQLGLSLAEEFNGQPLKLTILITHTHWDHIQGFPFFRPAYNPKNQIQILGYEGARAGLAGILSNQMESPYFPVELRELPGNIVINELKEMEFSVGKVRVKTAFVNHPGICVGYRLECNEGSIAYLPDIEPFQRKHVLQRKPESPKRGGTEFAVSEDHKIVEFIKDVDLLIMDAQYDGQEYREHAGWGHGCVDDAVALAGRGAVKKLYLFHHDPDHGDDVIARMVEQAQKLAAKSPVKLQVEAAREGEVCELPLGPRPVPDGSSHNNASDT
jgi:phosphoribosyl 1,2-cyclic phosphodiesterase/CheY-like chemotaxis protein